MVIVQYNWPIKGGGAHITLCVHWKEEEVCYQHPQSFPCAFCKGLIFQMVITLSRPSDLGISIPSKRC